MKFVHNAYKVQSYDAIVKKQFAIKKLIQATLSDSNRMFNKWRKISNQQKITQKISSLDRIFSFTQQNFVNKLQIFEKFRQENLKKSKAVQKLFTNQLFHLQDSYNRWRQDNRQFKYQTVNKILSKYTQQSFNKRFLRQGFIQIKQKYQIQSMKGYVNSLWKWKMANTESIYYEKFIKVFRQSQQLLNLSKLLNKKQCDTVHYAFGKIKQTSIIVFHRKVELVEKYMKKKVSTYLNRIRKNAFKNIMEIWKGKYAQSIQVETLSDVLAKVTRKLMLQTFYTLKNNEGYLKKVEKLTNALKKYQGKGLTQSMKNIYRYGYYKIFKVSYDTVYKIKQFNTQSSFDALINFGNMRKFFMDIKKVQQTAMVRFSLNQLKKNKENKIKQKLSILLLSEQIKKKDHKLTTKMLNIFRKNNQKTISSTRIYEIIDSKLIQKKKLFFNISQNDMKMVNLLQRFKKGNAIKNILDKQDKKLLQSYFNKLKKKQNKWIGESIRKFATRSSIRSTLAISLWRFKTFAEK